MKCYIATVEVEVMFVCPFDPSSHAHQRIIDDQGRQALQSEIDSNGLYDHIVSTRLAEAIPPGWDGISLVYGTKDEITAEQALKLNQ